MDKIKLIMWKNFKIIQRTKKATIIEILIPTIPVLLFVGMRLAFKVDPVPEPRLYEPFSVEMDIPVAVRDMCNVIYYAPSNPTTNKIINEVKREYFDNRGLNYTFQGFDRNEKLMSSYEETFRGRRSTGLEEGVKITSDDRILLAAVIFENIRSPKLPSNIKYTLRFRSCQRTEYDSFRERNNLRAGWFTDFTYPIINFKGPRSRKLNNGGFPGYFDEGFLYLQNAVDHAISNLLLSPSQKKELNEYEILLKRFPFPAYNEDKFTFTTQTYLPIYIAFSFVYAIMNLTKMIVHEKSSRLKEFMKIMGLDDWVHWTAWFLRSLILLTISAVLMVILVKIKVKEGDEAVFTEANPIIIFIVLMATIYTLVGYSFFCSTLFDDEQTASLFAGFTWILVECSYIVLFLNYPIMKTFSKFAISFMTIPVPMSFAFFLLGAREMAGDGTQWSNFWDGYTLNDSYSVGHAIVMLIINGSIYIVMAIYIQLVLPGKYGVPLPWYFPFMIWYWTGSERKAEIVVKVSHTKANKVRSDVFEKEPETLKAGIDIRGLNKAFASKVAVNNLSMKMFENQVTSLLGHNGAGKTTTMSILTGLTKPSSGTALVNSFDIRKNMIGVRSSIGLCPQYNILFDDMTVEEHLTFYCKLKGYGKAEVLEEIDRCLRVLGLEDKRYVASKNLSGGMKRKLCVGMAFSAGSKVVLLDEPTAGMDPAARRSTWELIQAEKAGRTVLLSTHYMEEADLLGDRIAIMANGQLQCCGSSLFLKSKYGGEYTLIIVKSDDCDVARIRQIILSVIPDADFQPDVGSEMSCTLPAYQIQKYAPLFEKLDARKQQLKFESYGVASTTMEQVFFRVGLEVEARNAKAADGHQQKKNEKLSNGISQTSLDLSLHQSHSVTQLFRNDEMANTGRNLWRQQIKAMVIKKIIYGLRNKTLFLLQVILPIVLVACTIWMVSFYPGQKKAPKELILSLDEYEENEKTITLINCPLNSTLCQGYKAFLTCNNAGSYIYEDIEDESLTPVILDQIEDSYVTATGKYILGIEESAPNENSSKTTIIGYFNNQQLHNPPLALNFISNGILRSAGIKNEITITNYPFDYDDADDAANSANTYSKPFTAGYSMGVGLAFLSATFVMFPVQERQTKFKQLQVIAGVTLPIYWMVHFMVDFTVYMICCLGTYVVVLVFDVAQYKTFTMFMKYMLISGFYGCAMISFTMLLSRIIQTAASGYARLVSVNASVALLGLTMMIMLRAKEFDLEDEAKLVHTVLLFHPNYAVGSALMDIGLQRDMHKYCPTDDTLTSLCNLKDEHPCCDKFRGYFAWKKSGVGRQVFHMGISCLISLALLILFESGAIRKLKAHFAKTGSDDTSSTYDNSGAIELLDADVMKEIRRINQSNLNAVFATDNLIVKKLTKTYGGKFRAVKSISFGVPKGETFGLLGSNGAGKTTTFKMLTGDISITSGDAFINTYSVSSNLEKAHAHLGYCPQFDACLDQLTGRETLTIFARLRGISETEIPVVIDTVADDLLFTKHLDKNVGSYSGGNKRKLSTALAMLGNPSTIFLDEPTAGMDPVACRNVWDAINRVRDRGTSVVLTSHNMEECEALCSKLGIMVKGQFKCIGSPQHLKSKLCRGYTLVVLMTYTEASYSLDYIDHALDEETDEGDTESNWETRLEEFTEFLCETFSGCFLKTSYPGFAEYHIPHDNNPWSKVFGTLEEAKTVFALEAYSVGQNNLEQVFFTFTQDQD